MPTEVQRLLEEYTDAYLAFYPTYASGMGLHQYDGQIGDLSAASIASRVRALGEYEQRLATLDRSRLSPQEALDLALVERSQKSELFEWTDLRDHERNPIVYNYMLDVTNYIKRNYAPLPDRVRALTLHLEGIPELLRQARANLNGQRIPKPFVETGLDVYRGYVSFYEDALPAALADLRDRPLFDAFLRANQVAVAAVREFLKWLEQDTPRRPPTTSPSASASTAGCWPPANCWTSRWTNYCRSARRNCAATWRP